MYDNKRYFQIEISKPSYAQWFAEINISSWVGTETLNAVNFTAKNKDTGVDATSDVLDNVKSTYANNILKPFIKGGVHNSEYRVKMEVATSQGSKEVFYLDFDVANG